MDHDVLMEQWADLHDEAASAFYKGDFARAEEMLAKCLTLCGHMGTEGLGLEGNTLNTLAGVLAAQDRVDEALEKNARARALLTESLGADDPNVISVVRNAAQMLGQAGRAPEAVAVLEETMAALRKAGKGESPESARIQFELGVAQLEDAEKAAAAFRKATEIARADQQGDTLSEISQEVALAFLHLGQPREALKIVQKTLEAQDRLYRGNMDEFMAANPNWLADDEIARFVVYSLNYQATQTPPPPMTVMRTIQAQVHLELDELKEAAKVFAQVEKAIEQDLELAEADPDGDEDMTPISNTDHGQGDKEGCDHGCGCGHGEEHNHAHHHHHHDDDGECEECGHDHEHEEEGYFLDRSAVFTNYGVTLHIMGQRTKNRKLLTEALEKYQRALDFIAHAEDADSLKEQLEAAMAEITMDLKRV